MADRPILFSAPMVRALLAGTKTQTRRALRDGTWWTPEHGVIRMAPAGRATTGYAEVPCPYGQPGDRLWVREATIKVEDHGWVGPVFVESDAGREALEWGYGESDDPDHIPPHAIKRRPGMFMRRSWSRIMLEITGVRVERLQDISEADARAEGVGSLPPETRRATPKADFHALWEQINGPGSWDANPWVWVLEFRRAASAQGEKE